MNAVIEHTQAAARREHTRTGLSTEALKQAYVDNLFYLQGRFPEVATPHDLYMAAAYTVRDRLLERWIKTARTYKNSQARTVCYLSAEFLLGPHLLNNLINLGILERAREAGEELELDFQGIIEQEEEPGLGNGGLGRLAACYMDSLATLQIPAIGYGIRYEFGIFDQMIENGWQVERTDAWLRNGNPWELPRPKLRFPVKFGGHTEQHQADGHWGLTGDVPVDHAAGGNQMTPLERVEALYEELVRGYGEGTDREIRAASKLLMVALLRLKEHGGFGWQALVEDYLLMLRTDPERYRRMLEANRGEQRGRRS